MIVPDPHIGKLALCLRDDNLVVKRHALTLITNLLASDFVKWRGTLFFRYLVTLVDDNESVRQQVRLSACVWSRVSKVSKATEARALVGACGWQQACAGLGAPLALAPLCSSLFCGS